MGDLSIEFDVSDLKKLQTNIEKEVQIVTRSGEGSLIAKAALVVERQAKINATGRPGPNVITGRLRASIIPNIISYTEATVGTNVEYAPFVEFGHFIPVGLGSRGGSRVQPFSIGLRHSPAYPYLYPAIDQCKGELEGVFVSFSNEMESQWSS
jgi:phage gpG-like protein